MRLLTPYSGGLGRLAFSMIGVMALFALALALLQHPGITGSNAISSETENVIDH